MTARANTAAPRDVDPAVPPEHSCSHPYFSEHALFFAMLGAPLAAALFVLVIIALLATRRLAQAGTAALLGTLTLLACYFAFQWGDELIMRLAFGADDWARLQRQLQTHEAALAQYGREHPEQTTVELVKSYLATQPHLPPFQPTDPSIAPLHFKISDWRDTRPRVVVGFGCNNNVVFNSTTMAIEQID